MTNILILGNMMDKQTGLYVLKACRQISSNVALVDVRKILKELGYKI